MGGTYTNITTARYVDTSTTMRSTTAARRHHRRCSYFSGFDACSPDDGAKAIRLSIGYFPTDGGTIPSAKVLPYRQLGEYR